MARTAIERRQAVLRALVREYIESQEPVGSKTLVERHNLGVSSATIRNDMAYLEEHGYITSPHVSSGRIPTQKAYREFVDSLHEFAPLSDAEVRGILHFLESGVDVEDVLQRAVRLLSQLTHQAAAVQLPAMDKSKIRHIEVVSLSPTRLLLIVVMNTGRVDQRNVELEKPVNESLVLSLRDVLNNALVDQGLDAVRPTLLGIECLVPVGTPLADALRRCATVLVDTLAEVPNDKLMLAGAAHLSSAPTILEALEEQVVVLKLLSAAHEAGTIRVSIGSENEDDQLNTAAVIATGYGVGGLGVLGPTCMDYPGTISKVAAVAHYVNSILGKD
ncbi:MAG: heat-inducible transcriptional repressor HrcA [Corynebacterium sp.]|nr:heat-inducible transcriptional repressor HrcA [Corynebacterium sp.]